METIWAILKSIISNLKLLWVVFGQILEKFGLLFISKSGHTALVYAPMLWVSFTIKIKPLHSKIIEMVTFTNCLA